ncbi:18690_t:CDS:2, partial [Acaulospora morrowiae]
MSYVIIDSSSESVKRELHIDAGDHECWFERACGECTQSQKSANNVDYILEWIPFEQFYDIREIDKGAFSIVYLAYWMDGPLFKKAFPDKVSLKKNEKRFRIFYREGHIKVMLKKLKKSQDISVEFINELKVHHKLYCKDLLKSVIRLFGISKDPRNGEFYMVLEYCEHGNMRRLSCIHKEGFTHNDLHGGNLLFTNPGYGFDLKIADLGLSGPANQTSKNLCGYSSLDEFAEDVWEFKLKMFDISCQEINNKMEVHPKAIYTSQIISDLTKNIQWESNGLAR